MILISLGVRIESVPTGVTGRPRRGEAERVLYDSTESVDKKRWSRDLRSSSENVGVVRLGGEITFGVRGRDLRVSKDSLSEDDKR